MVDRWRGINKVKEECAELICILSKLAAYPDGVHPSTVLPENLKVYVEEELADVIAAAMWFTDQNSDVLDVNRIDERVCAKMDLYNEWNKNGDGMSGL